MPELAVSYLVGATVTFITILTVSFFEYRVLHSEKYQQLQKNLNQMQMRWSDAQDKIVPIDHTEGFSFMKSIALFGVFCIFLSWLGLFFFILVLTSIRLLHHSPRKKILQSPLSEMNKSTEELQILLKTFI